MTAATVTGVAGSGGESGAGAGSGKGGEVKFNSVEFGMSYC